MNVKTTSSETKLSNGPAAMPQSRSGKPTLKSSSSEVPLSRTPNPVAQFGGHPGQGSLNSVASQCNLSRSASSPYDHKKISETKPQTSFQGGRKRK